MVGRPSPGERFEAPDRGFVGHRDVLVRSRARYRFAARHLRGAVLDIGCGRGYGFQAVRSVAEVCVGVDVSPEFLADARVELPITPLANASGDRLPFASGWFDAVVSFEVIEHVERDAAFVREVRRVACDDAVIAISTPNRPVSSKGKDRPLCPFHVREYSASEFRELLMREFSIVTVFGQHERPHTGEESRRSLRLIARKVPQRWKNLLPAYLRDLLVVAVHPPLRPEQCTFESTDLESAHTLLALCRP